MHFCNPSYLKRLRQKDLEYEDILGSSVTPSGGGAEIFQRVSWPFCTSAFCPVRSGQEAPSMKPRARLHQTPILLLGFPLWEIGFYYLQIIQSTVFCYSSRNRLRRAPTTTYGTLLWAGSQVFPCCSQDGWFLRSSVWCWLSEKWSENS